MTTVLQSHMSAASPFKHRDTSPCPYPDLSSIKSPISYPSRTKPSPSYIHSGYERSYSPPAPSSAPSSPTSTHLSVSSTSTPASSLSLDQGDELHGDGDLDNLSFPAYDQSSSCPIKSPSAKLAGENDLHSDTIASPSEETSTDLPTTVRDDQELEAEPTRHVDYLSHEWREEDIWSSWRYITRKRTKIANNVRLENASWRTWMKAKYNLRTISPETLNWLKDCDVTWLYGPLQIETKKSLSTCRLQQASRLSTSSSFSCKKPILKKKSASAVILERSRSQQSLLQRAGEIIQQQQASPAHNNPILKRGGPGFALPSYTGTSTAPTPAEHDFPFVASHRSSFTNLDTPAEQKHVFFDEEVRQVQAVDTDDEKFHHTTDVVADSDEDDDGGLVMSPKVKSTGRGTPRGSFSSDSKTIIPLPSTTLKYRTDTPEPPASSANTSSTAFWPGNRKLSPSASQETLRPVRPHHNFLIDDDPEVSDEPWNMSNDLDYSPYEDENESGSNMRRTESGMFMPYDENNEEGLMNKTLLGQAAYAVNTFKDIAHVVWNVGWTRNK